MSDNFYVYVDREGKMPQLRQRATVIQTHPYFVRYVQNVPAQVLPYPGQTQVWNYASCSYDSLCIVKSEDDGDELPMFTGTYEMCTRWLALVTKHGKLEDDICIKNLFTGRLMSFVV